MISVSLRVIDDGLIDAYIDLCQRAPDFVNTITNRTINDTRDEALADFQQEPGPVKTPIAWTSPKQRRYVMAMKRKGLIASPYIRTHNLSRGWSLAVVYSPGELSSIELSNPVDYATFVIGLRQQGWMAETGWYYAPDKVEKWQRILTDRLETDLIKAFDAVEPKE